VEPELELGAAPLPAGGAPWEPEPLPMLGQLWVEPDPEPELELDPLEPELELDPEPELDEPLLVLPEPVLEVLVLDDGVVVDEVEELDVELEPVFPELDGVAALATSAPPAKSPDESAPTASTLRKRMCMRCCPFVCGPVPFGPAPHTLRLPPVACRRVSAARWWSCLTIR
jgi:hypothetical protein